MTEVTNGWQSFSALFLSILLSSVVNIKKYKALKLKNVLIFSALKFVILTVEESKLDRKRAENYGHLSMTDGGKGFREHHRFGCKLIHKLLANIMDNKAV